MEKKKSSGVAKKQEGRTRLVHPYSITDPTVMSDFILCVMAAVEDGLISAGAKPGQDYDYRDLLQAATPIVARQWSAKHLALHTEWRD